MCDVADIELTYIEGGAKDGSVIGSPSELSHTTSVYSLSVVSGQCQKMGPSMALSTLSQSSASCRWSEQFSLFAGLDVGGIVVLEFAKGIVDAFFKGVLWP